MAELRTTEEVRALLALRPDDPATGNGVLDLVWPLARAVLELREEVDDQAATIRRLVAANKETT
jgi:hypothetical protein